MSNEFVTLNVELREPGSSNLAKRMRGDGKLPAVLYGGTRDPRTITVSPRSVVEILQSDAGQNSILKLTVDGGTEQTALIHDYQVDPISRKLVHADFMRISMDVVIEVEVPIEVVGEARGVRIEHGILEMIIREVSVECLPGDIPEHIAIDVSDLDIGDSVHLRDLVVPAGVELHGDPEATILMVAPPTVEEVVEEAEVDELLGEAAEPEVIGRGDDESED